MVAHLRDLELELQYGLRDGVKVLETVGKLRSLQTLRLTFHYWTPVRLNMTTLWNIYPNALYQDKDMIIMGASLPYLRDLSLVIRRRSGASTKIAAYIVKTLTADAALETLDLQCDYKGWDTPTIYRAIKRHSKTLRVLCAPGWYAHTAMLQALDKFSVLEEVTIGRIVHLEVRQLRFPYILSPMFPGGRSEGLQEDPEGLPLQPPTFPTSSHGRGQDATPSK